VVVVDGGCKALIHTGPHQQQSRIQQRRTIHSPWPCYRSR
jgi:hypothetical protein